MKSQSNKKKITFSILVEENELTGQYLALKVGNIYFLQNMVSIKQNLLGPRQLVLRKVNVCY